MRNRLVLIGCFGPHETPWMTVQGGECRIRILHLGEGELITIEDAVQQHTFDSSGEFPFAPSQRFKVRKSDGTFPTTVEVISNG